MPTEIRGPLLLGCCVEDKVRGLGLQAIVSRDWKCKVYVLWCERLWVKYFEAGARAVTIKP